MIPARDFIHCFDKHPYPARVVFVPYQEGWDALSKELDLPQEPIPDKPGMVTHFSIHEASNVIAISFGPECETRSSTEVISYMVHELVHVKQYLEHNIYSDNTGDSPVRLDQETEAYLTQSLFLWLINAYTDSGRSYAQEEHPDEKTTQAP